MTEIPESRVYLGNFIHSYQKHLFSSSGPSGEIIFSDKDFYERMQYGGLRLMHKEKIKLRARTSLFQAKSGHLPKSFCISAYQSKIKPSEFTQGQQLMLKTVIRLDSDKFIALRYILQKLSDNDTFKLKLEVWTESGNLLQKDAQGTHIKYTESSFLDISFCFSFVKYQWKTDQTKMMLFFGGSYSARKLLIPRSRAMEASVKLIPKINLDSANVDIFFEWICVGGVTPSYCQNSNLYVYDYREFNWGHSNYRSEEVQKLDTGNNFYNIITDCYHSYGSGGSNTCMQCRKNYDWRGGACIQGKTIIENCAQLQSVKTEVDGVPTEHCQRCNIDPTEWGIAPPACISGQEDCKGPEYNLFSLNRCDHCIHPAPNNCICNAYQTPVLNPVIPNANYCRCTVDNCKCYLS